VLAYFGVLLTEIRGSFSITLCFDFCAPDNLNVD